MKNLRGSESYRQEKYLKVLQKHRKPENVLHNVTRYSNNSKLRLGESAHEWILTWSGVESPKEQEDEMQWNRSKRMTSGVQ